jgi:molybdopterin/thiamine biosynthesis adenylyltransferase
LDPFRTIPALEAKKLADRGAALLDVREPAETASGTASGAILLPRGLLERDAPARLPDRARPVVCYCATGVRSRFASQALVRLGYREVYSVEGGFEAWTAAGLPREGGDPESRRYARHLVIPEVGPLGQRRLKEAKVLLVGAGGLGSPAAVYLACAGVGQLGLVDPDVVDESNLQRQILHTPARVGMAKVESGRRMIAELNPFVRVEAIEERLTSANADAIVPRYDLVIDGADNFPTRYLINDACVKHGKPNVHGSVYRFEGQVSLFLPRKSPCYRCLYPEPPPPELAPSCAEAGVLGVLPGIVGLLQAIEALKVILGVGETLAGRLLLYDALHASFRELRLSRRQDCPVCAEGIPFPGYVDYEGFCNVHTVPQQKRTS